MAGAKETGTDGRKRCHWVSGDPVYVAYHDHEWGVPERGDRALFEKLVLDSFQSGLSWIVILRKRDNFRRAFEGFAPEAIARFDSRRVARLMADPGIVRNRAKIEATIANARAYLGIMERTGSFADFIWQATDGRVKQNRWRRPANVPAQTPESQALSKLLRAEGFAFVGPTVVYAFMQAVGMVNDHLVDCFRHAPLAKGHR